MKHFIRRAISLMLVGVMLILSLLLGGCSLFNQGVEDGFEFIWLSPLFSDHGIAYRSDVTEFDIDNVTLTLYYGYECPIFDYENIPILVTISNYDAGKNVLIRKFEEEEFYTEERKATFETTNPFIGLKYRCTFNYSETITIPKELFTEEKGMLFFRLELEHLPFSYKSEGFGYVDDALLSEVALCYEIRDNKVIISRANTFTFTIGNISFKFWR